MSDYESFRRRAVEAGTHWCAATLLQIHRVAEVGRELIAQHRARPFSNTAFDEDAYRAPWLRLEADRDFLKVAAFNLVRAVEFLRPPMHVDTTALDALRRLSGLIKTLRDCTEHWDEEVRQWVHHPSRLTGKAFDELAQLGPSADIRSHQWTASGATTVAGVLSLDELRDAVLQAQEFFACLEQGWFVWDDWPSPTDTPTS